MTTIKAQRYRSCFTHKVSAAWLAGGEALRGDTFSVELVCSSLKLHEDEVLPREHLLRIVNNVSGVNLTDIMAPREVTLETLSKLVAQMMLDYLFKTDLHQSVKIERVRVTDGSGQWAEVEHEYKEDS